MKERFAAFPNVHIHQGSVPDSFASGTPDSVAYLHIDMNAAEPERAALEFFWNRLVPGAPVILDDYAWVACWQQKQAMDEFALQVGCEILTLPTGQGMLMKPVK